MTSTPLTVLDLVPISSGSNATQALRNSIDLAQQTEWLGYARYWFAEHHLNPGVAGTSPAVVLALTAAATSTIRLGSGAVQMGHRTALSIVEEFGLLDAPAPGPLRPRPRPLRRPAARSRRRPRWPAAGAAATVVDGRTAERAADPAPVLHPRAARLTQVRAAEQAAAAAARASRRTTPSRSATCSR